MIHVENKRITVSGEQGQIVSETGAVIDTLAETMSDNLGFSYEVALQIIIESIYRGCLMSRDEKRKDR